MATTFPLDIEGTLPLALTDDQIAFWRKLQPVNRPAATDTYKRTMAGSGATFNRHASYSLAARKELKEEGANGRLVTAGLERMLYPWFGTAVTEQEVRKAEGRFRFASEIRKFPTAVWEEVLANDGRLPLDLWGFPGGQTFLVDEERRMHVPLVSVEGPGALVSHIEPHMLMGHNALIAATKARLMRDEAGEKFAEFGYRSASNDLEHTVLMMALKVGGGFHYTSNDETVYLFPEQFTSIGTVGHEYIMAYQRRGLSLEEAQQQAFREFVEHNEKSALLPDIIDTVQSGLPLILTLVQEYQQKDPSKLIMPRFDSGDVAAQTVAWKRMTLDAGLAHAPMVVEDGYTPGKARATKEHYAAHGFDPDEIIVGAGGYFQDGNSRDAISLAYKRTDTEHDGRSEPSIKFSDTPGKFSLPGPIRVYEQGSTLLVARKGEVVDGTPLYTKLVDNGRINYFETLDEQAVRAARTWNAYDRIAYSPQIQAVITQRTRERDEVRKRL